MHKCLQCNKEVIKTRNTTGKYCSNICQKEYQSRQKLDLWLSANEKIGKRIVRRYLIEKDGDKCSVCGINHWLDKSINFEIDHIDGNAYNNLPINLRLICPNCHAQTLTYKNRNRGNGRKLRQSDGWLLI